MKAALENWKEAGLPTLTESSVGANFTASRHRLWGANAGPKRASAHGWSKLANSPLHLKLILRLGVQSRPRASAARPQVEALPLRDLNSLLKRSEREGLIRGQQLEKTHLLLRQPHSTPLP
jgi:hypothetical protein